MLKQINEFLHRYRSIYIISILLVELALTFIITKKVKYTEIDWIAYMQEVKGYLDGERNYMNLKGDTGPLVYPAGFVYVFSFLYNITNQGVDIVLGQYIFLVLYIINLIAVLILYITSDHSPPLWTLLFLILSKRIHSIFVLRLFNDCIAVFFGYIAMNFFIKSKWRIGCFFYSCSVSIKMNMLLYAPGLLLLLLLGTGINETIICLSICAIVQLILGFPFLSTYPLEYIHRAFELGRVFQYQWTVNFRFLSEELFINKYLSLFLLVLTVGGMIVLWSRWIHHICRVWNKSFWQLLGPRHLSCHFIIITLFISNFIGITFARSLHYQFYVWYFHTLPYMLWTHTQLPEIIKVCILIGIEVAFNVYPSTNWSSAVLQICHFTLLIALYCHPVPPLVPVDDHHPPHTNKHTNTDKNDGHTHLTERPILWPEDSLKLHEHHLKLHDHHLKSQ